MPDEQISDPNPPSTAMPHGDTVSGAPPATSEAIGGQINEDTFLGVRLVGPYAGMLLANNPGDPGINEGVEMGLIVPVVPVPESPPEPPVDRVPVLAGLSPASAEFTVTELTIQITGSDFEDGDVVYADTLEASTVTVVDAGNLTAHFSLISVSTPRSVDITVMTIDGNESNALPFAYTDTVAGGE
jgi:hypothetical protein